MILKQMTNCWKDCVATRYGGICWASSHRDGQPPGLQAIAQSSAESLGNDANKFVRDVLETLITDDTVLTMQKCIPMNSHWYQVPTL